MFSSQNIIILCIFIGLLLITAGAMFYLGICYGKEEEKDGWHKKFLKDVVKSQSKKWVCTVLITYRKDSDVVPDINVAIGSMKPADPASDGKK